MRIGDALDSTRPGASTFTTGTQASAKSHTTASGSVPDRLATAVAADATNSGSESTSGTRHGVGRARFSRNDVYRAFAYVCTRPNRW